MYENATSHTYLLRWITTFESFRSTARRAINSTFHMKRKLYIYLLRNQKEIYLLLSLFGSQCLGQCDRIQGEEGLPSTLMYVDSSQGHHIFGCRREQVFLRSYEFLSPQACIVFKSTLRVPAWQILVSPPIEWEMKRNLRIFVGRFNPEESTWTPAV